MDLITIATDLGTDAQCLDFIESVRWPDGVRCPICGGSKVSKFQVKETTRKVTRRRKGQPAVTETVTVPARDLYECLEPTCHQQFAATTGTLFHDTHLPLQKWLYAVALMVNAKKGLSALQLKRDLKVTYKTAWYLCHRIREAMQQPEGLFGGPVELDETYIGGKFNKRGRRARLNKQGVMGVAQRGDDEQHSPIRAFPIPTRSGPVVQATINRYVAPAATIYTDEAPAYRRMKQTHHHEIVIHSH